MIFAFNRFLFFLFVFFCFRRRFSPYMTFSCVGYDVYSSSTAQESHCYFVFFCCLLLFSSPSVSLFHSALCCQDDCGVLTDAAAGPTQPASCMHCALVSLPGIEFE